MDEMFAKVERAKQEWEATIDALSDGVALYQTASLEIRRANWRMARLLHSTPRQLVGVNIHQVFCGCAASDCSLLRLLSALEPVEQEIWRDETHQRWQVSIAVIPNFQSAESNTVIVVRDVTQERALQDCLIEAEKKAVALRVAASLAEQVTPSIRYCLHYLATLSRHVAELRSAFCDYRIALNQVESMPVAGLNWEQIESRYSVEFILQDIAQAVNLTQNDLRKIFSTVSHISNLEDSRPQMSPLQLNRLIEDALGFMQDELGDKIGLESSFAPDLPAIYGNPVRMQMALTSLLGFFAQSLPVDGRIKIETFRRDGQVQVVIESHPAAQRRPNAAQPLSPDALPQAASDLLNLDRELIANIIQDHGGQLQFCDDSQPFTAAILRLPVYEPAGA